MVKFVSASFRQPPRGGISAAAGHFFAKRKCHGGRAERNGRIDVERGGIKKKSAPDYLTSSSWRVVYPRKRKQLEITSQNFRFEGVRAAFASCSR